MSLKETIEKSYIGLWQPSVYSTCRCPWQTMMFKDAESDQLGKCTNCNWTFQQGEDYYRDEVKNTVAKQEPIVKAFEEKQKEKGSKSKESFADSKEWEPFSIKGNYQTAYGDSKGWAAIQAVTQYIIPLYDNNETEWKGEKCLGNDPSHIARDFAVWYDSKPPDGPGGAKFNNKTEVLDYFRKEDEDDIMDKFVELIKHMQSKSGSGS